MCDIHDEVRSQHTILCPVSKGSSKKFRYLSQSTLLAQPVYLQNKVKILSRLLVYSMYSIYLTSSLSTLVFPKSFICKS